MSWCEIAVAIADFVRRGGADCGFLSRKIFAITIPQWTLPGISPQSEAKMKNSQVH
jgi:hypothetical protein